MRLVAFGCSNTYGQGLHDCYLNGGPGPHPSKYAWPAQLAKELNCDVVNLGSPGASNRYIWHRVVNFDYEPDDLVIVHWTLIHRYTVLFKDRDPLGLGLWDIVEKDIGDPWKRYITAVDDDYDRMIESCTFIDHAEHFLKHRVKTHKHLVFNATEFSQLPTWCSFEFLLESGAYNHNFPLALDNAHTGPRGHKALARAIKELL